jgi:outer membrane protein TolC
MRLYLCLFLWALTRPFPFVYAQTVCESNSWQDIAKSAMEKAPEIIALRAQEAFHVSEAEAATLAPASVANVQYATADRPWQESNLEASYLWTIERQDKRQARVSAARARLNTTKVEMQDQRAQIVLKIVLLQNALLRIENRREVLLETQGTYRKIIRQYENRLTLGPEQEASLAVFRLAKKENDLRIESLSLEENQYVNQLSVVLGCRLTRFPRPKGLNSEVPGVGPLSPASPALERMQGLATRLELEAKSETQSYSSDLSMGPLIIADRGDRSYTLKVGLVLSIPMDNKRPLLLSNAKAAEFQARKTEIDLKIQQFELERQNWMNQYEAAVKALKNGLTVGEISATHHKLENLFRGERVGAALIIESHRQMLEHITSVTDLEAKASEALWNIRYLDGNLKWSDL